MKLLKLHGVRKFSFTSLILSVIFVATLIGNFPSTLPALASSGSTIAVKPVTNIFNPTDSFTVDVTITDAVDLFSYETKLRYNPDILEVDSIEEGPFIKDQTTSPMGTLWSTIFGENYVYAVCVTVGKYPGVSGSGTLFNVTFTVKAGGESPLDLYGTILLDSTGAITTPPDIIESDGTFRTTVPAVSFSFTPEPNGHPIVGENVTFDASASFDPDGGAILNYTWNFGDGTNVTVGTPIIKHVYNEPSPYDPQENDRKPYNVTLTIIDDDGENNTLLKQVDVKFHDIAIVEIINPEEVFFHDMASINVTALNNGSHQDTFNVTAYYNSKPIETEKAVNVDPGKNVTFTFIWNTYINQTTISSNTTDAWFWSYPLNASTSDDVYTYSNTNQSSQLYLGYEKEFGTQKELDLAGWAGISKVEVGVEAKTDSGGDDQLGIRGRVGTQYRTPWYIQNITWDTDKFFWVDVTGNIPWTPQDFQTGYGKVEIKYIQVGDNATPIYVDWLPLRITPTNPVEVPEGTYAIWANAYLVHKDEPYGFRPGEEEDTTNNVLFGNPLVITEIPYRDIAVLNVTASPTEVAVEGTSEVKVKVKNNGNREETFGVFLYVNSTEPMANQTGLTLDAGADKTLPFTWFRATNTTVEGIYNITVVCGIYNETTGYIDPLVNETDTANNVQTLIKTMRLLPVASFTYSPSELDIGEEVTFDASTSFVPGQPGGNITAYLWDFRDGTNGTGVTITHIYSMPKTYNVKLTVIDDQDLNSSSTKRIVVAKLASDISLSISNMTVPVNLNTTLSGSISPLRGGVTVTVDYRSIDEVNWTTLEEVLTDEKSQYSLVWTPTEPGIYQIRAYWLGDTMTLPAGSSVLNVTATVQDIALIGVSVPKVKATAGEILTIGVIALNKGTVTETFDLKVYYNNTLLLDSVAAPLAAGKNETITVTWDTKGLEEGIYTIRAIAQPLPSETYKADNSRTTDIFLQEAKEPSLNLFLYTTIGMAILVVAMIVYLLKLRGSKPK